MIRSHTFDSMTIRKARVMNRAAIVFGAILLGVALCGTAGAATYYWDNDGATAGFGTASGTWAAPTTGDSTQGWSTNSGGTVVPGNVTTGTADVLNFGNGATGLGSGTISVSGTVNAGNITFASGSDALTLSGGTAINLAATQTITVDNASDTIATALTGAGTSLTKAGTGTLVLNAASSRASGQTILSAGTLKLGSPSALGTTGTTLNFPTASPGSVTLDLATDSSVNAYNSTYASSAVVTIVSDRATPGAGITHTLGNGTPQGGSALLKISPGANVTSGIAGVALGSAGGSFSAQWTIDSGAALTVASYNLSEAGARTLTINATGDATITGTVSDHVSGALSIAKNNGGTLTLSGSNSYKGLTTINAGTVSSNTIKNLSTSSSLGAPTTAANGLIKMGNATTTGKLLYTGTGDTSNRTIQVGVGTTVGDTGGATIQNDGSGALTFSATTFNTAEATGTATRTLTLQGSNTGTNTISGIIQDNVATTKLVALTKDGVGTWFLDGQNTYRGTTTIKRGTLQADDIVGTGSLGAATSAVILGDATNQGTLSYTGGAATYTRGFTIDAGGGRLTNAGSGLLTVSTGAIASGVSGGLFTVGGATQDITIDSLVSGNGGLTKTDADLVTLTNNNSYTGNTTVSQGILALSNANSNNIAGSPIIDVASLATLDTTGLTGLTDLILASGQTIQGNGTVLGALTIASGSTLSPGSSPGILNETGDQTWSTGGDYNWQILDATGIAGVGFDQMAIDGSLTINSGFDFNLWSLSSITPDVNGNALNFNSSLTQYWIVATTTTGLTGAANLASANIFTAANNGTGGFTNGLGGGTFSLIQGDGVNGTTNDVVLKFTAVAAVVPEPSTYVLGLIGLAGVGLLVWRRRRIAISHC